MFFCCFKIKIKFIFDFSSKIIFYTFPIGLFGVLTRIRRVRELNIDSNSFLSRTQSALDDTSALVDSGF